MRNRNQFDQNGDLRDIFAGLAMQSLMNQNAFGPRYLGPSFQWMLVTSMYISLMFVSPLDFVRVCDGVKFVNGSIKL